MSPAGSPFTRNLRALKNDSGLTWPEIASNIGVHKRQLFFWLSGQHEPTLTNLRRLADCFGVSLAYFDEEHEDAPAA